MASDLGNMLRMMNILGDEGFVDALENAERLVKNADETLERVEQIEGDAERAVREANETLTAVDNRLAKFDETISLLEAKIEAGFSVGFFFFGLNRYLEGELLLAGALFFMGLLGASSLVVTIVTLPQVRRLREMGLQAYRRVDEETDGSSSESTGSVRQQLETGGHEGGSVGSGQEESTDSGRDRPTRTERRRRRSGRYGRREQ
ncbi:hypothetical protein GRX03_05845 [Halovenus sp. WSH3]|uniref:Uncharacterized protein n=1 Tax=Halovenus carboxidivorans TaxID=2692199 RepID=A0A6B0SZ77_9EURY|nr:hypothetical protein [Halovenus carboxidivorans]MXR51128.1 hypothetical protein [Halovenus carboxidivorans]